MLFLQNIRVQLQERRNRLFRTNSNGFESELRYLMQFINKSHYLNSLIQILESNVQFDFESWAKVQTRGVDFPETEDERAKVCYEIIKRCLSNNQNDFLNWGSLVSSETNYDSILRDFTESIVDPFINYLHDRVDESNNILYALCRFKLKSEWFDKSHLYESYKKDTQRGEAALDSSLRLSLFENGIDYPMSSPVSPSGKADVVALLDKEEPLVLEVKVFDPSTGKTLSNIKQGVHQVLRYAGDYHKSTGYLIVFNCSDQLLTFEPSGADKNFPPRVIFGDKTIFIINIDINSKIESASKEKTKKLVVKETDFVD